jgi:hypothetical protein
MNQVVAGNLAQEIGQAINLGELSQRISRAAMELSKVAEVVGCRLAGFDDLIRHSRIDCLRKIDQIQDGWYGADFAGRKSHQKDLMNALTDAASTTPTRIFQELQHVIAGLRDVATRANVSTIFDKAEADIRELSLECLTFIGSLHSKTQVSQDIISFDKDQSEYSEVIKTHKALHDKLFDLSVSFQRCIQDLAGSIVIFTLQDASHEHLARSSMESGEDHCAKARQLIRDATHEISMMRFTDSPEFTAAGRDSMRTALGLLDHVIDSFSNATRTSRPTNYNFSGLTRSTSEIKTALILISGDIEHLVAGMQSTRNTTVEHSLEEVQRVGATLDSLLRSTTSSTQEPLSTETLRLLAVRDGLIEHLQAGIRQESKPDLYLLALSSFGLTGLDRIKDILLSEQSAGDLRNACLGRLTSALRQQSSPSALPEDYNQWFGELLANLQVFRDSPDTRDELCKLQDFYHAIRDQNELG